MRLSNRLPPMMPSSGRARPAHALGVTAPTLRHLDSFDPIPAARSADDLGSSGPVSVVARGVNPAAAAAARAIADLEVTRPDVARNLTALRATFVIIPDHVPMTSLPEFTALRGQKTFDGRPWDEVRGSGGMRLRDGRLVIGIAEENLIHLPDDPYGRHFSVAIHELAHVIMDDGLPKSERD